MRQGYYPASFFHYDRTRKQFSAELSQLDEGGRRRWYRQIYSDAADAGITVMGRTADVDYYIAGEVKDDNGDVMYIKLLPTPQSEQRVPGCKGTSIVLLND